MSALRRERQVARREQAAGGRRRLFQVIEALLWIAVAGLFIVRVTPQLRTAVGWGTGGGERPAVTFDMLSGGALPLSQLRGQVVLVNFWATWCPPCRAEMPNFQMFYDATHPRGFEIVGVSMDEASPEEVAAFLRDHRITYPVAMATTPVVAAFGGVNDYPTSFLIDRLGRVRYTVRGIFATSALRAAVDSLLAERS
jgi:cytochrome c biogenesis protein CcmG/thiol:disulfide interchange protein DsbE